MNQNISCCIKIVALLISGIMGHKSIAQGNDCILKPPLLTIDFGAGKNSPGIEFSTLRDYERQYTLCPIDGHYSFAPYTSDCFRGDWFTMNEDHTPNDEDGNMMLVNASETGGIFLSTTLSNLSGNTTYQLAAWMLNICRINGGCAPLPPDVNIILKTTTGQIIGDFKTGLISQTYVPHWTKYSGFFTTPRDVTMLVLTMEDETFGGCGNDFALDDITIRECIKQLPVSKSPPLPKVDIRPTVPSKPRLKEIPLKPQTVKNEIPVIQKERNRKENQENTSVTKPVIVEDRLPQPIASRANPIVKQIETVAGDMEIDVYDNGEIDGDTVSIYHNNELIISRAGLSDKPITFHIKVNASNPHHELLMVADNLGSIPPNTSLMIITANNKRSEVFISSSEQKNAKVVIDLKE